MKKTLKLAVAVIVMAGLSSCRQMMEEITPNRKMEQCNEAAPTTTQPLATRKISIPVQGTASPCGEGFKVTMYPSTGPNVDFYYRIRDMNNVVQDQGWIQDGANTNWGILNPCTQYQFEFWGYSGTMPPVHQPTSTQTVTSDGCNNNYIC